MHSWFVNCSDAMGQWNVSETWNFTVTDNASEVCEDAGYTDSGGTGMIGGLRGSTMMYVTLLGAVGLMIYKTRKGDKKQ